MNNKTNGQTRSSFSKGKNSLFDNLQVSVDKLRHRVSQTMASTDIPRNLSKSKGKSNPHKKQPKPKNKRSCDLNAIKTIKDTYNNTDRLKKPVNHHHQTQVYQNEHQLKFDVIKARQSFLKLRQPTHQIKQIRKYYYSIKQIIQSIDNGHLNQLLTLVHTIFTSSINQLFDLIEPYQDLLLKRKQIQYKIEEQLEINKQLSSELTYSDGIKQISRLNSIIQSQRKELQKLELEKYDIPTTKIQNGFSHDLNFKKKQIKQLKDFKIDLSVLKDSKVVGYHDQFMSKLPEMSQSWRQQAIKQQRY